MSLKEKIVYFEVKMFNSLSNVYNLLKTLQRQGHNVDEAIKEFIRFYRLIKNRENTFMISTEYKKLYAILNDIKENLCEGDAKIQLNKDISTICCKSDALDVLRMEDM